MYGWNFLRLSSTQKEALERLNKSARRLITGLPKFTEAEDLEVISGIDKLKEIAAEVKQSILFRVNKTPSGRKILKKVRIP